MSRSTFSSTSKSAFLYSDSFSSLNLQGNPPCPFAGHALVYHAQVKEPFDLRRGNREKKDSPNFFVKAFRWYTQEHKAHKNKETERSELDGFALWLDRKYDQFLYDSQLKNAFESRLRILSSVRTVPNKPCNPSRRGRLAADCRDGGDGGEKCQQSFEIILQPKELSRPASECCFQYKPAAYCNSSKVTVASSDTAIIKKRSILKIISDENQGDQLQVIPPETNVNEVTKITEKVAVLSSHTSLVEETNVRNETIRPQANVRCLCPEEHVVKTETSTQYEKNKLNNEADGGESKVFTTPAERKASQSSKLPAQVKPSKKTDVHPPSVKCLCPKKDHVKIDTCSEYSDPGETTVSVFPPCVCRGSELHSILASKTASNQKKRCIAQLKTEAQNNIVKEMCSCSFKEKELGQMQVHGTPLLQSSDTAQTSDHSIVLDDAMDGFPLLVRIVTPKRATEDSY